MKFLDKYLHVIAKLTFDLPQGKVYSAASMYLINSQSVIYM